jgi:hypothetical protein
MHKESTLRKTSKRAMLLVLFRPLIIHCIHFYRLIAFGKHVHPDTVNPVNANYFAALEA